MVPLWLRQGEQQGWDGTVEHISHLSGLPWHRSPVLMHFQSASRAAGGGYRWGFLVGPAGDRLSRR